MLYGHAVACPYSIARLWTKQMATILITGATGNVGAAVLESLRSRHGDSNHHLRATTREPSAEQLADAAVEWVAFDFDKPSTVEAALRGVQRVFLMRPPTAGANVVNDFVDRAKAAGVEQIVYLSVQGVENNRLIPHYKTEQHITTSGVPHTFLRAGFFMQNLDTQHRRDIRDYDEVLVPAGKGRVGMIDVRDIGAVGAKVLADPSQAAQIYTLTGSEAVDYYEVARVLSEVLGRKIVYPKPSIPRFVWTMWRRGTPLPFAAFMVIIYGITRFGGAAEITPDVAQTLGRQPIGLRQYAGDYREAWVRS